MIRCFSALALFLASGAVASSTTYTPAEADFERTVLRTFENANRCRLRVRRSFPNRTEERAIAAGVLDGCRRFWPAIECRPYQVFAWGMKETEGRAVSIPTRWGHEAGWPGLNVRSAAVAAAVYGLPWPSSEGRAVRRLRTDHRWAGLMFVATVTLEEGRTASLERGFALATFGPDGFRNRLKRWGPAVTSWPYMRGWERWLALILCWRDGGEIDPCACARAMQQVLPGPADGPALP